LKGWGCLCTLSHRYRLKLGAGGEGGRRGKGRRDMCASRQAGRRAEKLKIKYKENEKDVEAQREKIES
jgi:hypothetical protein